MISGDMPCCCATPWAHLSLWFSMLGWAAAAASAVVPFALGLLTLASGGPLPDSPPVAWLILVVLWPGLSLAGALVGANEAVQAAGRGSPPGVAIAAAVLGTVGVVSFAAVLGFVVYAAQ